MQPQVFDLETSISKEIHGSDPKYPNNDFYTIITGGHPNAVTIKHCMEGFKRNPGPIFKTCDIVVGHNLSFDLGYVWHNEQWQEYIRNEKNTIWDCQEAEYILSGQRHKFASLAELQQIYLGKKVKDDRIARLYKKGIGADKILNARNRCRRLFKLYEQYCCADGVTTLQIFAAQYRRARQENCLPLLLARMKGLLAVIMMQNTGINIDREKCENTFRDFKLKSLEYLHKACEIICHLWDDRLGTFNINSPKQKSAMLFGGEFEVEEKQIIGKYKNGNYKWGKIKDTVVIKGLKISTNLTEPAKTPGQYKTDDKVMRKIELNCLDPLVKEYCKYQKLAMQYNKMCSTYLDPFLKYSINGVLFPNYNTTLTETSRLSSSRPNLQNVPASGPMLNAIQGQLMAPEGWEAVDIDFSQLEPFITAMLTNDTALTNDLLSGICLHCRAVSWVPRLSEGKTYEEIYQLAKVEKLPEWELKRKKAKGINFKRAYGGGAKSLAEAEGLDIEDVKAIFQGQEEAYYEVKNFMDKLYKNLSVNQQLSKEEHFGRQSKLGRRFKHGIELLPIFDENKNKTYLEDILRHFGTYTTILGHKFTFEEFGRWNRFGNLRKGYSTTETKNYEIQGTAGDIVQVAAAECMVYVLNHSEEVRMVRQIHDSLGFYIKKGTTSAHIPALCAIMKNVRQLIKKYYNIEVPFNFLVEAKIGPNFAEMSIWEK